MADSSLSFRVNCSSGVPLIALGGLAVLAGIVHHSAGAIALGTVLISVPLAVLGMLRHSLKRLAVQRFAARSAVEGDTVEVRLRVENNSRLPVFYPEITEIFAPEIHEQKVVLFPQRLPPGEALEETYTGRCLLPRGRYGFGPTALSVSDPFGWFQIRKHLGGRRTLKVYPRLADFGLEEKLGRSRPSHSSTMTRPAIGEWGDFFSVREYRRGDALRRIHWRVTAHRGYPVVREYTRVVAGDLTLFLDTFRKGLIGVGRSSSLEHAVKIVGALGARAVRQGQKIRLVGSPRSSLYLPASSGPDQLERLLDLLVDVRPAGETPLTEVLRESAAELKRGGTVFVPLAPYLSCEGEVDEILTAWCRRGVRVVAVVFDAETFRTVWNVSQGSETSRAWAARLERCGIEVVLVPCAADLRAAFAATRTEARA